MRGRAPRSLLVVTVALMLPLAGCGTAVIDPVPAAPVQSGWDGRVEVDERSGEISLAGFNEHIDVEQPAWASTPATTVAAALRLGRQEEDPGPVEMQLTGGSGATPTIEITFTDVPDDSVAAVRYELRLHRGDDGLYRFSEGSSSFRCQPGRGGTGRFGSRPCT